MSPAPSGDVRADRPSRRLTGVGAFDEVFRRGTRREGRYVQLVTMPAAGPVGRAGMVIGRKALRRAVDRNRLKRLLREMLRAARSEANPFDLIIRVKSPVPRELMPFAAAEARSLLSQAASAGSPPAAACGAAAPSAGPAS